MQTMKRSQRVSRRSTTLRPLPKTPTGIAGLDEVTEGGLPKGQPSLICGGPGCGKTLLAMEFLVRGATQYNEPGVFTAFEANRPVGTQDARGEDAPA